MIETIMTSIRETRNSRKVNTSSLANQDSKRINNGYMSRLLQ